MPELIFKRVAQQSQVLEGKMLEVQVDDLSIVICHSKDGWHALDNICSHALAKMHEGRLRGFRLICPLHGAAFDCRSGAVLGAPAIAPLKTYPIRCVGEDLEIGVAPSP